MDANMAVFGVVPEMTRRGVGLTLLCHHMECADSEDYDCHKMAYDTMGLWLVGRFVMAKMSSQ